MICDKIIFRGQTLLTIFHQGFDNNVRRRSIKKIEKIGRYNLIFSETFVEDTEIENIKNWNLIEEGVLEPSSTKNPYGNAACAYMIHYSYANKPSSIYKMLDDKYCLKISVDNFIHINEFIKKYTGINVESNPMYYGDTFIFMCNERNYKANKDSGIILKNIPVNSTVIVHFKYGDIIVSSKKIQVETETNELQINSDKPWTSHDIEIYNDDKLVYYQRDISYVRHVFLKTNFKETGKTVKLDTIGSQYTIEKDSVGHVSQIGEPIDKYTQILQTSSVEIRKQIQSENPDDKVFFIRPGELAKATKLIGQAIESAKDDLWIFDSYFTDKNGIRANLDWLRIIANCPAKSKNIVFCSINSDRALNISEFISEIKEDHVLSNILRIKKSIGVHLYQVKSTIHDRFALIKNGNEYGGVNIGTSFNSLERNHYCISKLSHAASKIILRELTSWMEDSNIVADEEV